MSSREIGFMTVPHWPGFRGLSVVRRGQNALVFGPRLFERRLSAREGFSWNGSPAGRFGFLELFEKLDVVQEIVRGPELRLVSLAFAERLDGLLDVGVLGELGIFLGGRVGEGSQVQEGLVVGFAPIAHLGVDLLFGFRVGFLALELVEPGRFLVDLDLELISIEHELVVLLLGVGAGEPAAKSRKPMPSAGWPG